MNSKTIIEELKEIKDNPELLEDFLDALLRDIAYTEKQYLYSESKGSDASRKKAIEEQLIKKFSDIVANEERNESEAD